MMGALGNGRRGGRSSSLLLVALIACIFLLGFNYWVSNSRNVELQRKILELEDRMRKLAVESDREQQKAEDESRRQNEQLELMEETHQRQQESALNTWKKEKESLKINISTSAKMVQDMKNRMQSLLQDVSKAQSELKSCQNNMDTLSKKASSEMSQCNKQVEAIKEECNEKMAAAKMEKQRTSEKDADGSMPKVSVSKAKSDVPATNHSNKSVAEPPNGKPDVDSQPKNDAKVQTNELVVEKKEEDAVILQDLPTPTSKRTNKSETLNRPANEEVPEAVVDIKGDTVLENDIGIGDDEEEEEDVKIGYRKEEDAANGKEDAVMYDNEGEIEKQLSKIKDENQGAGLDLEDDVANYNGDDDNQPESEDEKQAELAGM
ncbi:Golgi membrane protein 1 isoform X1 [Pimephales promelas]|uniref:Golgi membrane protein 1 isoform X1 n=1 Tax=Pimephales promelas TaxID=90988 RepID=UPI001955A781|nr:Golgi membrane protein 1 isoform X1 [Pimephales promelas]XP_039519701.1 Golgi membrane protein 1 isoform X1 [Pimephales promelas]